MEACWKNCRSVTEEARMMTGLLTGSILAGLMKIANWALGSPSGDYLHFPC